MIELRENTTVPLTCERDWKTRFWARVNRNPDGCWLWTGPAMVGDHPYGEMMVNRKRQRCHRLSWLLHFGAIPAGMSVLHTCDRPLCVRPDHLFLGTQADNMADMAAKGRHVGCRKLSSAEAQEIRRLHAAGGVTHAALGLWFGVSRSRITQLVGDIS